MPARGLEVARQGHCVPVGVAMLCEPHEDDAQDDEHDPAQDGRPRVVQAGIAEKCGSDPAASRRVYGIGRASRARCYASYVGAWVSLGAWRPTPYRLRTMR